MGGTVEGVTVTFFSASLRQLAEQHGDRTGSVEKLDEFRRHLAHAERVYREMTPIDALSSEEPPK